VLGGYSAVFFLVQNVTFVMHFSYISYKQTFSWWSKESVQGNA